MSSTYKILSNFITGAVIENIIRRLSDNTDIPFDPANTDYANFKKQINADEAQLEDADGNLMSPEQAKQFVGTLP